jgi:hypothetical protein
MTEPTFEEQLNLTPAGERELLESMRARGQKLTKVNFLSELSMDEWFDFPLSEDILNSVPDWLPGKMPTSWKEIEDNLSE